MPELRNECINRNVFNVDLLKPENALEIRGFLKSFLQNRISRRKLGPNNKRKHGCQRRPKPSPFGTPSIYIYLLVLDVLLFSISRPTAVPVQKEHPHQCPCQQKQRREDIGGICGHAAHSTAGQAFCARTSMNCD